MKKYKTISNCLVMNNENGSIIPFDFLNKDYREYLAWLAEGNEPEPADPVTGE